MIESEFDVKNGGDDAVGWLGDDAAVDPLLWNQLASRLSSRLVDVQMAKVRFIMV